MNLAHRPNHDLKEDIRSYWSDRSKTFDLDFGHKIADGPEFHAWAAAIRLELGDRPLRVLELACGTGEMTRVLLSLGHDVTALDFSEAMLGVARAKHAGNHKVRFVLADAENTMEPDASHDAVVCRHLVWTLTQPARAFDDWHRVLKPGGKLLFFDGNWATPTFAGRLANHLVKLLERMGNDQPKHHGTMAERHASIMARLPFSDGLAPDVVAPMLSAGGFHSVKICNQSSIAKGQRARASIKNRLRTFVYRKFILSCLKG